MFFRVELSHPLQLQFGRNNCLLMQRIQYSSDIGEQLNLWIIIALLNMQFSEPFSAAYPALLDHIRHLLARDNLCSNTYLFKHIKTNLTFPIFALLDERRIAQITNKQQEVIAAVYESGYARVNNREVTVIDYPTIKISTKNQKIFGQIESVLKQQNKRYAFSQRLEPEYVNLTLYEESPLYLEQLMATLDKRAQFEKVSLFDDMKAGTMQIKKMKAEHKNGSNGLGKIKYSLDKPPQIFIRRAVDSSEDQGDNHHQTKSTKPNDHKKRYRQVAKQKKPLEVVAKQEPLFSTEDFPSLS